MTREPVRFVDAAPSARTLDRWLARVNAEWTWRKRRGVTIHTTYVEIGECLVIVAPGPR